nr:reverse transcriptase domain-containing protein [Tanacetum cinerariifolium]
MTNLRNEITRFQQGFDESFYEAWKRFNDLLRACLHHGFSELHQLETFYNALNVNDQDSLNSTAGGNFLDKMPRECLKIIESKSKLLQSRAKAVVAKVGTSSSTLVISSDVAELKDMVKALLLDKKNQSPAPTPSTTPAPVKAVEPNCVTCDGAHSYQNCPATQMLIETTFKNMCRKQPPGNNFNRGGNYNQSNFNPSSFNQGQLNRPQLNQAPVYQAYQAPIPQTQRVSQTDYESYVKANDAILRNMQSQGQSTQNQCQNIENQYQNLQNQIATLTDMTTKLVSGNTASSSGSGTLPVAPVSAPMPNLKPSIPYPSRRNNEKNRDQANEQIKKFYEIFKDMSFEISFTDVLIFNQKQEKLSEMARTTMNEHCSAVILNKLPRKLGDPRKFSYLVNSLEWMNPRAPLILKRCFLKTSRALIDVHKGELALRIGNEAITYNLDQTVRYSANYNQMTANEIDVVESACEEYSQEVLGFSNVTDSGILTPQNDPIISVTSPTLTPFGDSNFLLFEEADAFLEVELKDLPHHLEYVFLEGDNKLPVIIAKEMGSEEKAALINVLKSHKRAIAWKLSDIQGINPGFCTHKILMEEDNKPAVQHQRRVNPKIHDVIKKEVEKLLDAGLIYPISDSPLVSPVHCVPKKGGFTVVENEENELIPTRLVTRWRVCIDYRKLNEATQKDHFPLPFMDQMLERLAGNEYYCFLDGFSG